MMSMKNAPLYLAFCLGWESKVKTDGARACAVFPYLREKTESKGEMTQNGVPFSFPSQESQLMKMKFAVVVFVLLFAALGYGQAELDRYVGQYQVTGAPIMITVTATGGKLAIEATGQGKAEIELVSGEDYLVKGSPIKLTFQRDAAVSPGREKRPGRRDKRGDALRLCRAV
jgi:hypothetical protein